ncbi:MAG: oligopeptide transporter, OPT family [Gemmatimonadota bacterium]|nr:MAG: oligopeptide transporter, OPT family [Gemmatimonadota bacterium]
MAANSTPGGGLGYKPYVPADQTLVEFTIRALVLGLVLCVILGAANAYLGLKAGMTIAATYPAAVISMAVLRLLGGNILEENIARTVGSIGESIAAGAIFTIPAFVIAGVWENLEDHYWEATIIMLLGGFIGILFVTMLRRVLVEDVELPFPESRAAGEIHKAGRAGGTGAMYLFAAGLAGAIIQSLKQLSLFAARWERFVPFVRRGVELGEGGQTIPGGGGMALSAPGVSPAYIGVGYIIGPILASLTFAGGLLAWGLFVPLLMYFLGPQLEAGLVSGTQEELFAQATDVWSYIVRPIAIGGMLLSAVYTLWRMRQSLFGGIRRSVSDVKKAAAGLGEINRIEQDLSLKWVFPGIIVISILIFFVYNYFAQDIGAALTATIVMVVAGFLFAAVSGYLCGLIGSSNNPISGLTLSTVIVAAVLMVLLGQRGTAGIAAVLGVAAIICVSAAVAGEMLQDLKVGHILGGTPWKMQVGDMFGVFVASVVMLYPILILHQGDINLGGEGLGGRELPAPQASLMALVSEGIVGGEMAWPLVIVGMLMAVGFILVRVKSPMLVCVGMYLPLETTFAIFVGGLIKGIVDKVGERRRLNEAQRSRVENNGVLIAAGLIAGEALVGLVFAGLAFYEKEVPAIFAQPSFITSLFVFLIIGLILTIIPLRNAGRPDEPAPPSAAH